jgi:hypothetical protein
MGLARRHHAVFLSITRYRHSGLRGGLGIDHQLAKQEALEIRRLRPSRLSLLSSWPRRERAPRSHSAAAHLG